MLGLWERPNERIHTQQGIEFRDFFQQRTTIPTVFGFIPAASIYFDDPDGHVLELLARIPTPPRPDLGAVSWAEWTRAVEGAA
jgi:lactoylglutathione lyase